MKKVALIAIAAMISIVGNQPALAHHVSITSLICHLTAAPFTPVSSSHCNALTIPDVPPPGGGDDPVEPGKRTSKSKSNSNSTTGKIVVGCVMGSAMGLIGTSIIKARSMGFRYRWMSQAEFEATPQDPSLHLTHREAAIIGFSCGLGSLYVAAQYR